MNASIPAAVGRRADLVRNVESTFGGKSSCESELVPVVRDSADSLFQALTHGLTVSCGPGGIVECPHSVATVRRRGSAVWHVGYAWRQVTHHHATCYFCFGGHERTAHQANKHQAAACHKFHQHYGASHYDTPASVEQHWALVCWYI